MFNQYYPFIKDVAAWVICPMVFAYASIKIARFHFEKDMRTKYLIAKDAVANEILNSLCSMLVNMWEMVNIKSWIANGSAQATDPAIVQRSVAARNNFYSSITQSYLQLGKMGLYYGTEVVDLIAQLQSDLNFMVIDDNFSEFEKEKWDDFRRKRLLPILHRVHVELKNTVFVEIKSFSLYKGGL